MGSLSSTLLNKEVKLIKFYITFAGKLKRNYAVNMDSYSSIVGLLTYINMFNCQIQLKMYLCI